MTYNKIMDMEALRPVAWLPLAFFFQMGITYIITYMMAVVNGHIHPILPYISDTGACPPESCVFSLMLNIAAILMGWTSYVRYHQVAIYLDGKSSIPRGRLNTEMTWFLSRANYVSFWLLMFAALGISLVGNFQENNMVPVHIIGAYAAFCLGMVYSWIHVTISYLAHCSTKITVHLRALFSAGITVSLTMFIVCHHFVKEPRRDDNSTYPECDSNKQPAYPSTMRMLTAASEWLLAANFLAFYLMFYWEFKQVRMSWQKIAVVPEIPIEPAHKNK